MSLKNTIIGIFILIFLLLSAKLFGLTNDQALYIGLVIFLVLLILLIPSINKNKKHDDAPTIIDKDWQEGDYHNDFTRVGSSDDPLPVKPVDAAGDAWLHGKETFNEDLEALKITLKKDKDS